MGLDDGIESHQLPASRWGSISTVYCTAFGILQGSDGFENLAQQGCDCGTLLLIPAKYCPSPSLALSWILGWPLWWGKAYLFSEEAGLDGNRALHNLAWYSKLASSRGSQPAVKTKKSAC